MDVFSQSLFESLNQPQIEAVRHVDGPMIVLAGPGSGKTRVITQRIAYLLTQGIPAHQILALTFTNKSAEEMRSRVERLAPGHPVWIGTFHRFCSRLLRQHARLVGLSENFDIFDTDDTRRCIKRTMERLEIPKKTVRPETVASLISTAKNALVEPDNFIADVGGMVGAVVEKVYPAYQEMLLECNAADFDDLLLHVAVLLRDNPEIRRRLDARYRYILVDEYQDTNQPQYIIARSLSVDYPNLMVTGDPDQSIYRWRGADIRNMLRFEHDYPKARVVRLEQNYRSTQSILKVADQLIAYNVERKEKTLFTDNPPGRAVRLACYDDGRAEADRIAAEIAEQLEHGQRRPKDFAVFYRTNALSVHFEWALRKYGIPYQMVHGLEFFQRREIKDILAYLHLVNNPRGDLSLLRIINVPTRGIGKTTIDRLSRHAHGRGLSLLEAAREADAVEGLSRRAIGSIRKFVEKFDRMAAAAEGYLEELIGLVLEESGYREKLDGSKLEGDEDRLANVEQLLTIGRDFDERHGEPGALESFLEETALVADTDDWEFEADRVTLMTLHASKGLEFPCVYLVAVEEGLLPHERSQDTPEELEEERRLLFVGITRAQEELQLSLSRFRDFRGRRAMSIPSSFLLELPREQMELIGMVEENSLAGASDSFTVEQETNDDIAFDPSSWDYDAIDEEPPESLPVYEHDAASDDSEDGDFITGSERAVEGARHFEPDAFHQGMMVRHPEYGLGILVSLSGSGRSRSGTVDFSGGAERKKFVLEQSPLKPIIR